MQTRDKVFAFLETIWLFAMFYGAAFFGFVY